MPCCVRSKKVRKADALTDNEFVRVKNELTGELRVEKGPVYFFLL